MLHARGGCGRRRFVARLLPCAFAAACASTQSQERGGALEAEWSGADSGSLRATAAARWCSGARFGELVGVRGDTGIAIGFRRMDSLAPGRYPAVLPDSADTTTASATVGLRFLGRTSITGYQSDSGWVALEREAAGRLRVRFEVQARVVGGVGRIHLSGRAARVPIARDGGECPTAGHPSE